MALDKIVDSSQLDADLTTVADAIRAKGSTSAPLTFPNGMAQAIEDIETGGITPTGNINITDTNPTDVTNYATATVVDADLVAENIKKDVNILGIVGSFEGGGGGGTLPSSISKIDGGSFIFASQTSGTYHINHALGVVPKGFYIWTDEANLSEGLEYIIRGVFVAVSYLDADSTEKVSSYLYQLSILHGATNQYVRSVGASYSDYANANYISYNVGNNVYGANKTYKWIAWA